MFPVVSFQMKDEQVFFHITLIVPYLIRKPTKFPSSFYTTSWGNSVKSLTILKKRQKLKFEWGFWGEGNVVVEKVAHNKFPVVLKTAHKTTPRMFPTNSIFETRY